MRRAGNLWADVVSFDNLLASAYAVLRGKRGRPAAAAFFHNLEGNLFELQDELLARSYQPGAYRTFWIRDPKPRLISAAPIRDRVVHHALVRVIEPVFEPRFIHHSYACRTGKGTHRALRRFVAAAREHPFVLVMDVHKFFPSLDHEVLKARIRRVVKDAGVLWLCDRIIDGSNEQEPVVQHFPGDDLFSATARRRGIPIGNLTSQFFANVYLDGLDHFVSERLRVRRYLRYVDDFACFGPDKPTLRALRQAIREFLFGVRLRLNEGKSRIRRVGEGVTFLGFVVRPHSLRLSATAVRRQRRRLRELRWRHARREIGLAEVGDSLQAWQAHAASGTTRRLVRDVYRRFALGPRSLAGGRVRCAHQGGTL